ncbi:hypothetical protein [Nonomuraea jiangxiensis]|uniref:YD repeat-containing protein n=1 Tax=Nonomuraea jiangxiensis TaxID=633440 RepID=A0A1G9QTL1_9ACTN|nr:hypothetical protein [Nonomuraea jiangxiensis]SDM14336.1 YD repeat-containing protein [Nonomuraea jiangxiensis]
MPSARPRSAAETETYSHDANSNVWKQEVLGKRTTFTYDLNRLLSSVTNPFVRQ